MKDWYEGTLLDEKIAEFSPIDINYITGFNYYIGEDDLYDEISILEIDFLIKKTEQFSLKMKFYDVSSLDITSFGGPQNQLSGFSITNLGDRGFEKTQRYLVEDYESDSIRFYCAALEVVTLEKCR